MKPKIYENSWVPKFLSFFSPIDIWGITLGPFIFVRGKINKVTETHESIHAYQWIETYYVGFLFLYLYDYFKGLIYYRDPQKAYYMIRAEQEAYSHDMENDYLLKRKPLEWIKKYKVIRPN